MYNITITVTDNELDEIESGLEALLDYFEGRAHRDKVYALYHKLRLIHAEAWGKELNRNNKEKSNEHTD